MKRASKPKKQLEIRKETVRSLTSDQLKDVLGGGNTVIFAKSITYKVTTTLN